MDNREFLSYTEECFALLTGNLVYIPAIDKEVPVLGKPLVGFAAADDRIFESYKNPEIIGENYRTPHEWMPEAKTAAGFFFPFSEEIRRGHAASAEPTDEFWKLGYGKWNTVTEEFFSLLTARLDTEGIKWLRPEKQPGSRAVVPVFHGEIEDAHYSVAWSTRHLLYAAGLGTFGIHRHIITERGSCGSLCTLLLDLPLTPTPRTYTDPYEYCIRCGKCIERCPVGAITLENLRNLKQCSARGAWIREQFGSGSCGKCLVGTPCESCRP